MNTETQSLSPAGSQNNIPVVFTADQNFFPYLSVALQSIIDNASKLYTYDIIIIDGGISKSQKKHLTSQLYGINNFVIRYATINALLEVYDVESWWCSKRMQPFVYSRLFLPVILRDYDKVIYLDSDICITVDIAELYSIELGNNLIGAVQDFGDRELQKYESYLRETLCLHDGHTYFNSGVTLMNIREMNRQNIFNRFIEIAIINNKMAHDQNVLNACCQGSVLYLDKTWNAQWHVTFWPHFTFLTDEEIQDIMDNAKIYHYNCRKPNILTQNALAIHWWSYARRTPFYEQLLFQKADEDILQLSKQIIVAMEKYENNSMLSDRVITTKSKQKKTNIINKVFSLIKIQ